MYKFLLIEDSLTEIESCEDTVKVMCDGNTDMKIKLEAKSTYAEGVAELENNYQGVIVDLNLDEEKNGNDIIDEILKSYRMPVAIMTGRPAESTHEKSPVKLFTKGSNSYREILEWLIEINSTGIFNVMGQKGKIEEAMHKIFWNNLYLQIDMWNQLKKKNIDTESVLLRYAIAHIQDFIDEEVPNYFTEEMYISPPMQSRLKTGSIIQSKEDDKFHIVLSPPCDLAIYNGKMKTNSVLICEINDFDTVHEDKLNGVKKNTKKEKILKKLFTNNDDAYYHWLPSNDLFRGGYINFRNVSTYSPESLGEYFYDSKHRIQDYFVKNILNRFSAYYARQGQPNFDFDEEVKKI